MDSEKWGVLNRHITQGGLLRIGLRGTHDDTGIKLMVHRGQMHPENKVDPGSCYALFWQGSAIIPLAAGEGDTAEAALEDLANKLR